MVLFSPGTIFRQKIFLWKYRVQNFNILFMQPDPELMTSSGLAGKGNNKTNISDLWLTQTATFVR